METLYNATIEYSVELVTSNVTPLFIYPQKYFTLPIEDIADNPLGLWATLFHKNCVALALEKLPRDIIFTHGEDWFLRAYLYFYAKNRVHIENILYSLNRSGDSATIGYTEKKHRECMSDYSCMLQYLTEFYKETPYFYICDTLLYKQLVIGVFVFWGNLPKADLYSAIKIWTQEASPLMTNYLFRFCIDNSIAFSTFHENEELIGKRHLDSLPFKYIIKYLLKRTIKKTCPLGTIRRKLAKNISNFLMRKS